MTERRAAALAKRLRGRPATFLSSGGGLAHGDGRTYGGGGMTTRCGGSTSGAPPDNGNALWRRASCPSTSLRVGRPPRKGWRRRRRRLPGVTGEAHLRGTADRFVNARQTRGGGLTSFWEDRDSGHGPALMRLVVDASVAVKWLVVEEDSITRLRWPLLLDGPMLAARSSSPPGRWRRRSAMRSGAKSAWASWSEAMRARWPPPFLIALTMGAAVFSVDARRRGRRRRGSVLSLVPSDRPVYDCVYLALAHRLGATW